MGDTGICKFCGKSIWLDTEGWRHDSTGTMPICNNVPEPRDGHTLTEMAGSTRTFKRPIHGFAYGFDGSGYLKETINGKTFWPRLTAEDLTAADWQEV